MRKMVFTPEVNDLIDHYRENSNSRANFTGQRKLKAGSGVIAPAPAYPGYRWPYAKTKKRMEVYEHNRPDDPGIDTFSKRYVIAR